MYPARWCDSAGKHRHRAAPPARLGEARAAVTENPRHRPTDVANLMAH
ncbi:MAG: hypothetical protein NZ761_13110 [Dehalococcoidia bacterium]|nr:hypothetical protein [Dehalococcoidia bacterium]